MSLTEGAVVGNYRILGKLGEGGMGAVYRAVDMMIHREVAIKVLRPEIASQPEILDRFRSEAVLLAKLNHPAIAQLYAFFSEGGHFYMVMEYVAGETLERVIQQQGAMEWPRAFSLMMQVLDGIGHAHAEGILHRDLKPANVMITPGGKIKLMDFGIAQALGGARMTRQGSIIGTLEYLAPERIQGHPADARSDLYSAGVMLYEMLSGRLPFHSDSEYTLLQQQIQKAPPDLRESGVEVPAGVEAVVRTALEKKPERRYADAEAFSSAVASLVPSRKTASRSVVVAPVSAASPLHALMAKPTFWLASTAVLLVTAIGIIFAALRSHQPVMPVAVAESTQPQPQMYQPPPSRQELAVDSTPVVVPSKDVPSKAVTSQAPAHQPAAAPPVSRPSAQPKTEPPEPAAATPASPPAQPAPVPTTTPPAQQPAAPATPQPVATAPAGGLVRLSDAHSIFVSAGQGELDGYVRDELQRQLGGRLKLAASAADADVVMRVTLEEQKGKGVASAGRMFGVKDHATVRAVVFDPRTSHVIWQQGAGDRKPIIGSFRGESLKRLAERIVKELRDSYTR